MSAFESKFGVDYIQNPMDAYRKTDDTHGISYFDIPAGLTLYRGYKHKQSISDIPRIDYDFLWFGFNPDELTKYGIVHEYKTMHGFKLIALDRVETLRWIYENTDDDNVHRFLRLNFGYKSATEIGKRQSDPNPDKFIVRYLQNELLKDTEYVGYGISDMEGERTHFHPEICVFFPQQHIKRVRVLPNQTFEKAAASPPPVGRKTRARVDYISEPSSPVSGIGRMNFGSDFGDDGYSTPVGTPTKREKLFGGKKNKKTAKRRRTTRKTKRNRR